MIRTASYAAQRSSGYPLIVAGHIDEAAVAQLAAFDDVTIEITPWMQNVDGLPRTDVLLMLRRMNPKIRLWLYALVGGQWLPPGFTPQPTDHSGFRDAFAAVDETRGWLWGMDGRLWLPNFNVNLGKAETVNRQGENYRRWIATRLVDGIFLDCAHTAIGWTNTAANSGGRVLDVGRAGFATLAELDAACLLNVTRLIARLHDAGGPCFKIALNGTGPRPVGLDVDFREGLTGLIQPDEAMRWMETPGTHWLMGSVWTPDQAAFMSKMLRGIASHGDAIISCGPNRDWPPVLP